MLLEAQTQQHWIIEVIPVYTGSLHLPQCYHMFTAALTCQTTLPHLPSIVASMGVQNANHCDPGGACGRACAVLRAALKGRFFWW